MFDKIKIVTDTTASLTKKECDEQDIVCLETSYTMNGVFHSAFDEEDVSLPEFYKKLEEAKSFSTGCVTTEMFEECFNKLASEGYKVIYIGISGAISSTFSYSQLAAKNINEKYNQKIIYPIDSRTGSYGIYILIDKIKELIAENKSIDEIEKIITQDSYKIKTAFISPDLKFLLKSGRISHITLGIGSLLKIVPTIYIGEDGKFVAKDKSIGKKLAIKKLKTNYINYINENNCTRCYFSHCAMDDEIEDIKQCIAKNTKIKLEDMKTGLIDKTMSCGCGPKTVAAFCL